jgi:hypothetical protein
VFSFKAYSAKTNFETEHTGKKIKERYTKDGVGRITILIGVLVMTTERFLKVIQIVQIIRP